MCGVTGVWDASGARREEIEAAVLRMTETVRHRGPDSGGFWIDPESPVALGHRRLAVVDLSPEGHQPMRSTTGRYVISFNGEIFNFRALRDELEARNHRFRGHSDTEVILSAVTEWGLSGAVERFVGMFAFALWDREQRTLHLVRDRLGIKPLYYGWFGKTLLFGSELKALRAHPAFRPEIDLDALTLFLRHNYVPAPYSIYRGVRKLLPGCRLALSHPAAGDLTRYWSAEEIVERGAARPFEGSVDEAVEHLDALLGEAVELRMIADVPLGAFLSGGIDSSTVVALMQARSTRPVKTFTVGFNEPSYDESEHATAIAECLGTDHTSFFVKPSDAIDAIPRIPEWYDEPFADSSQIPTFLVSEMTRRHVTVALSGDGGDELFGGYERYGMAERLWGDASGLLGGFRRLAAAVIRILSPDRIDRFLAAGPASLRDRFRGERFHQLAERIAPESPDAAYRRLLSHWAHPESIVPGAKEPKGVLWDPSVKERIPDFRSRMQYLDLVTYLPDDILTKIDRASMAVSLETRVPLLDHRVVEFAWTLPASLKVREGKPKWILREVLRRYVPEILFDRPKQGFGVPIDQWLRGSLRDWAESLLCESRLRSEGVLDAGMIRRTWEEHLSGRYDRHYLLWDVLMFQAWKDRWC